MILNPEVQGSFGWYQPPVRWLDFTNEEQKAQYDRDLSIMMRHQVKYNKKNWDTIISSKKEE